MTSGIYFLKKNAAIENQKELYQDFGWMLLEYPQSLGLEVKELPSNDFPDEDGDDEYIPPTLHYKAKSVELSLIWKNEGLPANSPLTVPKTALSTLINYLTGVGNGNSGNVFNIHISQYGNTYSDVRFESIDDDVEYYEDTATAQGQTPLKIMQIKLKLKFNNPKPTTVSGFPNIQ